MNQAKNFPYLFNQFDTRLQIETKIDEGPLNSFTFVFLLFYKIAEILRHNSAGKSRPK